jgi:hypothetical protein
VLGLSDVLLDAVMGPCLNLNEKCLSPEWLMKRSPSVWHRAPSLNRMWIADTTFRWAKIEAAGQTVRLKSNPLLAEVSSTGRWNW